jgi:hypothetical protein
MAITKGHVIVCCDRNRRGGLKNIWLAEQGHIGTPAVTTASNLVTAFPTVAADGTTSTPHAYRFEFDRGTAGFNANATRENGSTLITVELEFYIPKVTTEVNLALDQLTVSCGIYAVVETYADDCVTPTAATYKFLLGYDSIFEKESYLEFASGEQTTGIGLQDANGTLVKLSGVAGEYPMEYSGAITVPASGDLTDPYTWG